MTVLARVPSLSKDGESYAIEPDGDQFVCSCARFSFGRLETRTCKHVEIYQAAVRLLVRCEKLGHVSSCDPSQYFCRQCLVALLAASARKVRGTIKDAKRSERERVKEQVRARRRKSGSKQKEED